MNNRLLSLLGLARRAGRLAIGYAAAAGSLQDGSSELVLLASDLSPRTVENIGRAARACGTAVCRTAYTMDEVSAALGAKRSGVISVCDAGFAQKARMLITTNREEKLL